MDLAPEARQFKEWLRSSRRASRLTQPQLAKHLGLATRVVFLWEYERCEDLPTREQLNALATALHAKAPDLPVDLLPSHVEAPPESESAAATSSEPDVPAVLRVPQELKVWLRGSRHRARLTQAALGDAIGVCSVTVCIWEHPGKPTLPSWPKLEATAAACGVELPILHPDLCLSGRRKAKQMVLRELPPPAHTLMEEIEQVATDLASIRAPHGNAARNARLFLEYYGLGSTLQDIGDRHRLTRERVRQVIARMLEHLAVRPARRERFLEVAERCRGLGPMPVSRAEAQLDRSAGRCHACSGANLWRACAWRGAANRD